LGSSATRSPQILGHHSLLPCLNDENILSFGERSAPFYHAEYLAFIYISIAGSDLRIFLPFMKKRNLEILSLIGKDPLYQSEPEKLVKELTINTDSRL
jgi:hypothetical protein